MTRREERETDLAIHKARLKEIRDPKNRASLKFDPVFVIPSYVKIIKEITAELKTEPKKKKKAK